MWNILFVQNKMQCQRGYLCDTACSSGKGEVSPEQMEDELVGEMSEMMKNMKGEDQGNMKTAIMHLRQACRDLKMMSPDQIRQMKYEAEMMANGAEPEEENSSKEGYRNWGNRYLRNRYYPWRWYYYRNPYYVYYSRPYYSYGSSYGYPYGPYYGSGYYW